MKFVRLALPILVALLILPFGMHGQAWPWQPATVDLAVYRHAIDMLLHGGNPLTEPLPGTDLVFKYRRSRFSSSFRSCSCPGRFCRRCGPPRA